MILPCALRDEQGNCLIFQVPAIKDCYCPHYTTQLDTCHLCGQRGVKLPVTQLSSGEWATVCANCLKTAPPSAF